MGRGYDNIKVALRGGDSQLPLTLAFDGVIVGDQTRRPDLRPRVHAPWLTRLSLAKPMSQSHSGRVSASSTGE